MSGACLTTHRGRFVRLLSLRVAFVLVALLLVATTLTLSSPAFAQGVFDDDDKGPLPCDSLGDADLERYNALGDKAILAYRSQNYRQAIETIIELREICAEDPVIEYNLARAYQRDDNCNMARYWYEQVLARDAKGFAELIIKQKADALTALAALEAKCVNSTLVAIECSDRKVDVEIGDALKGTCPLSGRVDAGTYEITGRKKGYETSTTTFTLKVGELNRFVIPTLKKTRKTVTVGTLKAECPEGRTELTMKSLATGKSEKVRCPFEREMEAGRYELSARRMNNSQQITVTAGEITTLGFLSPKPETVVVEKMVKPSRALQGTGMGLVVAGTAVAAGGVVLHFISDDWAEQARLPEGQPPTEQDLKNETDAKDMKKAGTITMGLGGAATVIGIIVVFVANANMSAEADAKNAAPTALAPLVTGDVLGLSFQASW